MPQSDARAQIQIDAFMRAEIQIDALMQQVYGLSLQGYRDHMFKAGFDEGRRKGLQEGRAAGWRAAKGLKEAPKRQGRPTKLDERLRGLLIYYVDQERKRGATVKEAAANFGRVTRAGYKAKEDPPDLPTPKELERAYYRGRNKRNPRSA
jgi:hypothetical protein